jgi:hypothetical protein
MGGKQKVQLKQLFVQFKVQLEILIHLKYNNKYAGIFLN